VSDDVAVQDSDDGQRRNDVLIRSQLIYQPSFGHLGPTAERGTVHHPHSRLIRGTFSTQEHRLILSRDRAAGRRTRERITQRYHTTGDQHVRGR